MRPILKISYLLSFLLLNQVSFSQIDFWEKTGELIGGSDGITDILCTSDGIVLVTTSDSGINKSTDNGISWTLLSRQIAQTICTNTAGDILIAKDSILISTDNGNTWITGINSTGNWSALQLNPSGDIFAVGNTIILSTDNGLNWQSTTGFVGLGRAMAVDSNDILFAGSMSFGVSKSTDNGLNWSQTSLSLGDALDLAVHPNNNIYAATNFGLQKSTNSGTNWNSVGYSGSFKAVIITSTGEIYIAGDHNLVNGVFRSTDEGNTWNDVSSGLIVKKDSIINKFAISHDGYLFAYTVSGKVFRSAQPVAGVSASDELPVRYSLSQNYPNPFNPTTKMSFVIGQWSFVRLKVFDVLGREVAVLIDEKKQPGEYNIQWNAEGFPSGVYFYRLVAGDFIQTNKMLVIK